MGITTDLIYIVIAALIAGFAATVLRQPILIGYIIAGIFVGPHTGGPTVERLRDIEKLAEVGAAFLLFTLGLKVSLRSLRALSRITFIMTPLQIVATMAVTYLVARWFNLSSADSLWIGAAVALSSTMVVLKTLSTQNTLDTREGQMMLGILVAQDLAVIPIMLIIPQIAASSTDYGSIIRALGAAVGFLAIMYVVGTRLLPRLFALVVRLKSRELFFLTTVSVALGTGFLAHQAGLSFALGAFVAGMLLSETDFQYQALSDIGGLRDLFGLIFFVSVGMLFDPLFFFEHVQEICALTFGVLLIKAILIGGIVRWGGYDHRTSLTVGLGLSQLGEFAFVIANAGVAANQLSASSFYLVISVAVLSMIATPSLFALSSHISRFLSSQTSNHDGDLRVKTLSDHVVIIGGGTVGQILAQSLRRLSKQFVVIDSDYDVVLRMRAGGARALYGDGSDRDLLQAAGVPKAALLLVATTHDKILPAIINAARDLRPSLPIIARLHELGDGFAVRLLPIQDIVQPQLEASLNMLRQALKQLGINDPEANSYVEETRSEHYALLANHS
jgi:CPA2 family monovalent cation:H+ antiporter-2